MDTRTEIRSLTSRIIADQTQKNSPNPYAYATGYLECLVEDLIDLLPKSKRNKIIQQVANAINPK